MTSLKEDFLILIYEKEKLLNSILYYQISNYNNYKVLVTDDKILMFESLSKKRFDSCIINLNYFDEDLKKLLKSKEISEDDEKSKEKIIQSITDDHIKSVDEKVSSKEKEIMTI